MILIDVKDVGQNLQRLLPRLAEGETLVLVDSNTPIAEIHAADSSLAQGRRIGLAKGSFSVPASFFESLSDDIVASFEGEVR